MEASFLFFLFLFMASTYLVFGLIFSYEHTNGSKRKYVAEELCFLAISFIFLAFSVHSNNINQVRRLAVCVALCREFAATCVLNIMYHVVRMNISESPKYKKGELALKIPYMITGLIVLVFFFLGEQVLVSDYDFSLDYTISSHLYVLLRTPFYYFDRFFCGFLLILTVIISEVNHYRNRGSRLSRALSLCCTVYLLVGLISTATVGENIQRDTFLVEIVQCIFEMFATLFCIIIFILDDQELMLQALKKNIFNSFGFPVFLFDIKLGLSFYNDQAEEFIEKYKLSTEKGAILSSYFKPRPFRFIGIPRFQNDIEIHYLVSNEGETYEAHKVPLRNRFGIICGWYITIHEFENSFLVSSLEETSYTDSLTHCKTMKIFENAMTLFKESKEKVRVYKVHLENLAQINETEGHDAGDLYLKTAVYILENSQPGIVYRLESSTFAFVIPEKNTAETDMYLKRIEKACIEFSTLNSARLELKIWEETPEELKTTSA